MKKFSGVLNIGKSDLLNGLIVAVISGVLTYLGNSYAAEEFVFEWDNIWRVALTAGFAYLSKNLGTSIPKKVEIDPEKTEVVFK